MAKASRSTPPPSSHMPRITYVSEQPSDYSAALDAAKSLPELVATLKEWESLCADALAVAVKMTEADFAQWQEGHAKERRGEFAGEEYAKKFGALDMPATLLKVAMVAMRFGTPWGCAYLRLKQTGNLEKALA